MTSRRRRLSSRELADVYPFAILTDQDARRLSAIEVHPQELESAPLSDPAAADMTADRIIRVVAAGTRERELGRLEQELAAFGVLVSQAELAAIACRLPLERDPNGGRLARFDLGVLPSLIRDGALLAGVGT